MRPPERLRDAVEHIQFEVDRLTFTAKAWRRYPDGTTHNVSAAVREACMVHCRNLIAFFYPAEQPHPADILAVHFLGSSRAWNGNCPDWLAADRTRLNRLLSHLTYKRTKYKNTGNMVWDLDRMVEHLISEWRQFLEALPSDRRDWFRRT